jgi:hypothetical protein
MSRQDVAPPAVTCGPDAERPNAARRSGTTLRVLARPTLVDGLGRDCLGRPPCAAV